MPRCFQRVELTVNGTDVVMLAGGDPAAPPLVFFHGAGTFHGWDFAEPWTRDFRVLMPQHPGFGESADLDGLRDLGDLVHHYIAFFDQLGLSHDVHLVGLSLGGCLAARFAIVQKHRLRRLVLTAPAGLRVAAHPQDDLFRIPPEQLVGRLVHRFETIARHLPADPHDVDFLVDRYRETRTVATMLWDQPYDRVIPRWLSTVDTPTKILWGVHDALVPVGCAEAWRALVPNGSVELFEDAGHLLFDESPAAVAAVARFCAP